MALINLTKLNITVEAGAKAMASTFNAVTKKVDDVIDYIKEKIFYIEKQIGVYQEVSITVANKVTATTFAEVTGDNYRGCKITGVTEGDVYLVTCASLNSTYCGCFVSYNLSDSTRYAKQILYDSDNKVFENVQITIPVYTGTKTVVSIDLYINGTILLLAGKEIKVDKLVNVDGALPLMLKHINSLNFDKTIQDVDNNKSSVQVYNTIDITTAQKVVAVDLAETSGTNWQSTKIVGVKVDEKYRVSGVSVNSRFPCCFVIYNLEDGTTSSHTMLYGEDNKVYTDEDIVIPEYSGTKKYSSIDLYINSKPALLTTDIKVGKMGYTNGIVQTIVDKIKDYDKKASKAYVDESIGSCITKVSGKNLYNKNNDEDGYLRPDGSLLVSGSWKTTGYIDINDFDRVCCSAYNLTISSRSVASLYFLTTYDSDKTRIKQDTSYNSKYIYIKEDGVRYIRFSYQTEVVKEIQVEQGEARSDYEAYVEYNAINNAKPQETNEEEGKQIICCIGDSLTYGHLGKNASNVDLGQSSTPYPSILQKHLGKDYFVKNFGIAGAYSTTIEGCATAFEFMGDYTIPASSSDSVYVKMKFLRSITNNSVNQFGPVLNQFGNDGGANPIVVNGVKMKVRSSILLSGDAVYSAYICRQESGDAFNVKQGDLIKTNANINYRNTPHIIFMGANGGWFVDGTTSIHSTTNINELMGQIDDVIRVSSKDYIVMSYWAWQGSSSQAWEGESLFEEKYGYHYLNLRKYFAEDAITDAIANGYITEATSDDTAAMALGKIPPTFLNANRNDIHMCDLGYKVLGDVVYKKYMEVYKKNITL